MPESTSSEWATALRGGWDDYIEATAGLRPELFAFGLQLTGNPFDGEDLVQEGLIRAFGAAAFQDGGVRNLRSYLFRTMSNLWIDQQRRAREVLSAGLADRYDSAVHDPDIVALAAAAERLHRVLAPRERAAIVLHEAFGYRHAEIAGLLATTEGAIRSALHRAKRRLSDHEHDAAAGTGAVEPDAVEPGAFGRGADPAVVDKFVAAFAAADIEALQALLADGAETIVFPAGVGHGATHAAEAGWLRGCLYHHHPDHEPTGTPYPNHVRVVEVAGEPVVAVSRNGDGGVLLEEIWRFETDDGQITRVRDYGFCPDFITWVGSHLDLVVRRGPYTFGGDPA